MKAYNNLTLAQSHSATVSEYHQNIKVISGCDFITLDGISYKRDTAHSLGHPNTGEWFESQ